VTSSSLDSITLKHKSPSSFNNESLWSSISLASLEKTASSIVHHPYVTGEALFLGTVAVGLSLGAHKPLLRVVEDFLPKVFNSLPTPEQAASGARDGLAKPVASDHSLRTQFMEIGVKLPIGRRAKDYLYARLDQPEINNRIFTSDPMRTLIKIKGYGDTPYQAYRMEIIIAQARDGINSGELDSSSKVEKLIATRYTADIRRWCSEGETRDYSRADLMPKHRTYLASFLRHIENQSEKKYVSKAILGGREFTFIESKAKYTENGENITFKFLSNQETAQAVDVHTDGLFSQLMSARNATPTQEALENALKTVAELEWLRSNMWTYPRGSAGIGALERISWLEGFGVDAGSMKRGIDPNLEALKTPLHQYIEGYPSFFKNPPTYYAHRNTTNAPILFDLQHSTRLDLAS
jgi:hypothetical protein